MRPTMPSGLRGTLIVFDILCSSVLRGLAGRRRQSASDGLRLADPHAALRSEKRIRRLRQRRLFTCVSFSRGAKSKLTISFSWESIQLLAPSCRYPFIRKFVSQYISFFQRDTTSPKARDIVAAEVATVAGRGLAEMSVTLDERPAQVTQESPRRSTPLDLIEKPSPRITSSSTIRGEDSDGDKGIVSLRR